MAIACLGWGSLIWNPEGLPCVGDWQVDGPLLPVEFARQSAGGRVTLVIVEAGPPVPVLWCELGVSDLDDARQALTAREKCKASAIGYWPGGEAFPHREAIGNWAQAKGLEGVVWTALPPKWNGKASLLPSLEQVVEYMQSLDAETRELAADYVLKAPQQVRTPYRAALEAVCQTIDPNNDAMP